MATTLNHINEIQRQLFEETISRIVAIVNPVLIICYGYRTYEHHQWSCFLSASSSKAYADYDLLIVTAPSQEREHEILDRLSNHETENVRITAVAHAVPAVVEALQAGSLFFTTVYKGGVVVYENDSSHRELAIIKEPTNLYAKLEQHWTKWFGLAERFYQSALENVTNRRNDVALFILHQTIELACIASLRTQMGYKPSTHNLKRLLALIENFTLQGQAIFPKGTKEETQLFDVLHRAYSDVRYKEGYAVDDFTASTLLDRVGLLLNLLRDIYNDKTKSLSMKHAEEPIPAQN